MIRGDESYGRNWGYYCLLEAFRDIFERGTERRHAYREILTASASVDLYRNKLMTPEQAGFVNGGRYLLDYVFLCRAQCFSVWP